MPLRFNDRDYNAENNGAEHGYYQHISLAEIVTNFMVAETMEGMTCQNISQTVVEYHAQRGVQELSYDTLRSVKSVEFEPDGRGSVILPQDAVGVLGVFWSDDSGYKHPMLERRFSGNPLSPLEDEQGNFLYDENGNHLYAEESTTLSRFNARTQSVAADAFYNYYAGSFENDELYDRYYSYYGRRFGSDPRQTNINGTYWFDEAESRVYIDSNLSDQRIVIDYVTDGLGTDLTRIRVHKYSEEALYNYIKWKIVSSKIDMPLYEKQLAQKMWKAARHNAKHRLSILTPEAIAEAFRGKYKWIKH